jgi:hypothetical protein
MPLARPNQAHDYMAALAAHNKQPLLLHQINCERKHVCTCVFLQPKCWWEVEQQDAAQPANQQQQQQQQQVPGASDSQHVVKLMANRVSDEA